MVECTEARFDIKPKWLAVDTAYGSGPNLNWLVKDKDIAPHIPVIDRSKREDGTFNRDDFRFDKERNVYVCPAGKLLTTTGTVIDDGETLRYLATTSDCRDCPLKVRCCPKASFRSDVARALAKTKAFAQSRRERKRVEMRPHLWRSRADGGAVHSIISRHHVCGPTNGAMGLRHHRGQKGRHDRLLSRVKTDPRFHH